MKTLTNQRVKCPVCKRRVDLIAQIRRGVKGIFYKVSAESPECPKHWKLLASMIAILKKDARVSLEEVG
jgi:hypothetical protein